MNQALMDMIKRHEGLRLRAYRDSLGHMTIGYGHLMVKEEYLTITLEKAEELLCNDIQNAIEGFWHLFPYPRWFSENRKNAIIDMIFQLGVSGFKHFRKAIAHIEMAQWKEAADDFRDSLWAKQTPERADEICRMIEVG